MDLFAGAITDSPLIRPPTDPSERAEQLEEHGFFVARGMLTPADCEQVGQRISDIVAGRTPNADKVRKDFEPDRMDKVEAVGLEREMALRKLMHSALQDEYFGELARRPSVLDPIVDVSGGKSLRLAQDTTLLKPSHGGREKPWHQDIAYFDIEPRDAILGSWIAVDEATVENGCMHVVAGSHKAGFLKHWKPGSGPLHWEWQFGREQLEGDEVIAVPLAPGDSLVFSGLLKHGTPPNLSAQRRRSLQYHYAVGDYRWIGAPEEEKDYPLLREGSSR